MVKLTVYTDGASRGNPGLASYGFVITDQNNQPVYKEGKYLGIATNNVAEYSAILAAFEHILDHSNPQDVTEIKFYMDSNLAAQQLSGRFKIKNPVLAGLIEKIKEIEKQFAKVSYSHVPRALNKIADGLANKALDSL